MFGNAITVKINRATRPMENTMIEHHLIKVYAYKPVSQKSFLSLLKCPAIRACSLSSELCHCCVFDDKFYD